MLALMLTEPSGSTRPEASPKRHHCGWHARTDKDRASETHEAAPQFVASLIEATRKSNALKSGTCRDRLVKRCHLIADFSQQLYVGGEFDRCEQ
jgi:hypothetical protein